MTFKGIVIISMILYLSGSSLADPQCPFAPFLSYQKNTLYFNSRRSAYLFYSDYIAVNARGAPNAYNPDDSGLDDLANSGYPEKPLWSGTLVPDPFVPEKAYIQKNGPFKGYFVSITALQNPLKPITDPDRYVDARIIPYFVFPGAFYKMKGTGYLGDLGVAIHLTSGRNIPFVMGDLGFYNAPLGEISMALARGLYGVKVTPKNGERILKGEILYVIFPYSSLKYPWPLTIDEIERYAYALLKQSGGIEALLACRQKK